MSLPFGLTTRWFACRSNDRSRVSGSVVDWAGSSSCSPESKRQASGHLRSLCEESSLTQALGER